MLRVNPPHSGVEWTSLRRLYVPQLFEAQLLPVNAVHSSLRVYMMTQSTEQPEGIYYMHGLVQHTWHVLPVATSARTEYTQEAFSCKSLRVLLWLNFRRRIRKEPDSPGR